MDWTQALTIIGVLAAFFIYLKNDINQHISDMKNDMSQRLNDLKTDMNQRFVDLNQRLSKIEDCIIPRKVFHIQETDHSEEPKEN